MNTRIRRTIIIALLVLSALVPLSSVANAVVDHTIPVFFHVIRHKSTTTGQPVTFTATVQPASPSASDPGNVEVTVKILNAPAGETLTLTAAVVQGNGALSDVQYTLTVTDTETGIRSSRPSLSAFAGQTIRIRIATANNGAVLTQDVEVPMSINFTKISYQYTPFDDK